MAKPLVSVVIISYNSRPYIEKCLRSLFAQKYSNFEVIMVINGSEDGSKELIEKLTRRRKKVRLIDPGENLWFSRGNNLGIKESKGEYVLVLNQDTMMLPDYIGLLVSELEADENLGSVSGKLLHYRYDIDSKTKILDSTGIEMFKSRKVFDRGQWEEDRGQYDEDTEIFGVSGAAGFYRKSALEDIKIRNINGKYEYFDENFTAYQEDVDLAWRLQLAGYKCRYVPRAVMYHGRTVGRSWPSQILRFVLNRKKQPKRVRKMAFRNHHLSMLKNEIGPVFWRHFIFIIIREFLILAYITVFEPFQYKAVVEIFQFWPDTLRKRHEIMSKVRVEAKDILSVFH